MLALLRTYVLATILACSIICVWYFLLMFSYHYRWSYELLQYLETAPGYLRLPQPGINQATPSLRMAAIQRATTVLLCTAFPLRSLTISRLDQCTPYRTIPPFDFLQFSTEVAEAQLKIGTTFTDAYQQVNLKSDRGSRRRFEYEVLKNVFETHTGWDHSETISEILQGYIAGYQTVYGIRRKFENLKRFYLLTISGATRALPGECEFHNDPVLLYGNPFSRPLSQSILEFYISFGDLQQNCDDWATEIEHTIDLLEKRKKSQTISADSFDPRQIALLPAPTSIFGRIRLLIMNLYTDDHKEEKASRSQLPQLLNDENMIENLQQTMKEINANATAVCQEPTRLWSMLTRGDLIGTTVLPCSEIRELWEKTRAEIDRLQASTSY